MYKKFILFFVLLTTMVGNITAETVGKVGTSGGALNTTTWSVENEDTWDDYLTQFSTEQTLTEGKTIHYVFTQTSIGVTNWRGWVLVVKSNGNNYRLIRQDAWEDVEGNGNRCTSDYNFTSDWAATMNGATVDMYVTLINGNLKMSSIVKNKNGSHYSYSYVQPTTETSFQISLSVNRASLDITTTETLNEAYTVTKATLDHTASTSTTDGSTVNYSLDAEKEIYSYETSSGQRGYAFAQFSYGLKNEETITSANLIWSAVEIGAANGARTHIINYLNSGNTVDFTAIGNGSSGLLRYNGQKTEITRITTDRYVYSTDQTTDVTTPVAALYADGVITFQWKLGNVVNASLCGKASAKFPVLKIVKREDEKVKTEAELWDFTKWTSTKTSIEALDKWSSVSNEESQATFQSVAYSSSGIPEANGLWFGSKDGSNVAFRVKVSTNGYIRPITTGGTISIPVQEGQIVTISAYNYESDKSSNYTLRSVDGSGNNVDEKTGNFSSATDVIYQAQTTGWVDFTFRSGTYPCIQKIRVDDAPGFNVRNEIVQTIPQQKAELIYLDFAEPEVVVPEGATITYTSSNYKIAYCPSTEAQTIEGYTWAAEPNQVGQVRFVGTGIVGITANVSYGGYTFPLSYTVLVRADEASMRSVGNEYTILAHDIQESKNILTTGGKLANRIVSLRSITAEFGPSNVFNTTIVRAITGNPVGSHTVGVTTLASNGWRDAYFQDTQNPKRPTEGTFYKFVPKANGTLTVKGYIASTGAPAIMLDASNGYAQVGNTIGWTANATLVTSTFTLQKDHEYYLFGVNPNYPDYNNFSSPGSWATYQLVSFKFEQSFKIVSTKNTNYLKDNDGNAIATSSVVVTRDMTTYTANFEGASQNVTARVETRGKISGATVTVTNVGNGNGNIKVDWNAVGKGEGGAIIVVANDGTDIYYTITVPYDVYTWDMHNYQSDVNNKQFGSEDLLDWATTYEVRTYNEDTRALTYLNQSVLTSHNSIAYDNAAYIGQTAGLVVEASDNSFGVSYSAPDEIAEYVADHQTDGKIKDTNGDGQITKEDLSEAKIDEILRSMLNHSYTDDDIKTANVGAMDNGAWLTVPKLKKGQHVAIKWYRHAPNAGDLIHVTNAHNLKKWIDGESYTSSDPSELDVYVVNQSGSSNVYNARYGWLEFVVANDGDVTFHVSDNGFTHIKKIAISGKDENNEYMEIDADMSLRTGYGQSSHTANTFYYNKNGAGVSQQFTNNNDMHCEAYLDVEFRLSEIKGTFSQVSITSGDGTYTYTPSSSIKGRFKAPVEYTTSYDGSFSGNVAYKNGQGGLLTVPDGQGTFYVEQIAYSNGNAVEYQKTLVHVLETGSVEQDYPYTWDFTNISNETKQSVTSDNSNWTGTSGIYTLSDEGQSNFVMGTDLTTTGGGSTGTKLAEYNGLGFLAQPDRMTNVHITFPEGEPEKPSHGGASGLVIGNDDVTTLVVPQVPAGMTVYVRTGDGNVSTSPFYVSMSGEVDGKQEVQTPTVITDDHGRSENVYTFNTNTNTQDVYIDVQNVTVKAIAVSKFTKTCWFKNEITDDSRYGYYYNTDSHDKPIDYSLTEYFTGKAINAYTIESFNNKQSAVALKYIYRAPANQGYVVETYYENDNIEKLPLFVPCENDKTYNMEAADATYLQPHVAKGAIDLSDNNSYYYVLTNLYYDINTGSSSNMDKAQVPGFYRLQSGDSSELTNNRAYLKLPKDVVDEGSNGVKQFIPLFDFEGGLVDAIDVISAESTETGIDVNGTFYTLQGMKVNGFPRESGIYIQNGKKVMVK